MNMTVEGSGGGGGRETTCSPSFYPSSLEQWEVDNGVTQSDSLYKYPERPNSQGLYDDLGDKERKKKKVDPLRFKVARISAVALLKMVQHAHSGGALEVMGLMLGYAQDESIVVLDAFALPVEGTETRVDAGGEAQGYMVTYLEAARRAGRARENVVGWYHSHPGYGCWLSGIDVGTQRLHQSYEDPYLAVVIDPVRTAASGKVDIGAFRTYPAGHEPCNGGGGTTAHVPQGKVEDYGVHHGEYYALDVSVFKSSLDCELLRLLWRSNWASTLLSVPRTSCDTKVQQLAGIADKMKSMCAAASAPEREEKDEEMLSGREVAERILAEVPEKGGGQACAHTRNSLTYDALSAGQDALSEMASLYVKAKLFC